VRAEKENLQDEVTVNDVRVDAANGLKA